MRAIRLCGLAFGLVLAASAAMAEPMWQKHTFDEYGVAVDLPGPPVMTSGTYRDFIAHTVPTKIYTTEADTIRYRLTVADFRDRLVDTPNILGEAIYAATAKGKTVEDIQVRTDVVDKAAYGRKITVDTKDGTRMAMSIYLHRGFLFIFETDILPGGDTGSPDPTRFHYSIQFDTTHDWNAPPPPRKTPTRTQPNPAGLSAQ